MLKLSKFKSNKNLNKGLVKQAGRNNQGKITVYHQGGGHKRLYRFIEFKRKYKSYIVTSIEYDPNRSAYIAYLSDINNKTNIYIIAPDGLNILDQIIGSKINISNMFIGDMFPISVIPTGTIIHNIELYPGKGAQLARSAGNYAQVLESFNSKYIRIKLSSGEQRLISKKCNAIIGRVSNVKHKLTNLKKAGRSRWLNKRPTVRGVAMNPIDHPHGGGEGKSSGGRPSVTPWGKPTKGKPTRLKNKNNKFIIVNRKKI